MPDTWAVSPTIDDVEIEFVKMISLWFFIDTYNRMLQII